jgi:hypothetical protein
MFFQIFNSIAILVPLQDHSLFVSQMVLELTFRGITHGSSAHMIRCTKHFRNIWMIETMPYIYFTIESLPITESTDIRLYRKASTFLARTPSMSFPERTRNSLIATTIWPIDE